MEEGETMTQIQVGDVVFVDLHGWRRDALHSADTARFSGVEMFMGLEAVDKRVAIVRYIDSEYATVETQDNQRFSVPCQFLTRLENAKWN